MAGGEQPLCGDKGGAALEVTVPVQRRLPGPRARRRTPATHHPAPPHALVIYTPETVPTLSDTISV